MSHFDTIFRDFAPGLVGAGLLDAQRCEQLVAHCGAFPVLERHKVFLEYELGSALTFAGYGHGFRAPELRQLLGEGAPFLKTDAGQRLVHALATDPFSRQGYSRLLEQASDTDTEWIEYDPGAGGLSLTPGVFFVLPPVLQWIREPGQLVRLEEVLGGIVPQRQGGPGMPFFTFLRELVGRELARGNPVRMYRMGLSEARAPGWVRFILGGLRPDSLDVLAPQALGEYLAEVPRRAVRLLEGTPAGVAPKIAASVDVVDGRVTALDLECPYLFLLRDWELRERLARRFAGMLAEEGLIAPKVAQTLAEASVRALGKGTSGYEGLLVINHFKFGVAGKTRGRIKAYAEALMWSPELPPPPGWAEHRGGNAHAR